jgi:hypothetical protein
MIFWRIFYPPRNHELAQLYGSTYNNQDCDITGRRYLSFSNPSKTDCRVRAHPLSVRLPLSVTHPRDPRSLKDSPSRVLIGVVTVPPGGSSCRLN